MSVPDERSCGLTASAVEPIILQMYGERDAATQDSTAFLTSGSTKRACSVSVTSLQGFSPSMVSDTQPAVAAGRRPGRPSHAVLGWAGAVLFALSSTAVAAPPRIQIENLRVGFGPNNSFKVGTWTPVWIQLRAGDNRFTGFMDVVV